jgi:chromosome segregation ATPase
MSEILNFRSAFNGFHREDVVHYIEYLNAKHTTEVNQLKSELEQIRSQNAVPADVAELQEQLAAAQEINDQLQAQITELEERCGVMSEETDEISEASAFQPESDWEARYHELERQLEEIRNSTAASSQYHFTQELEAYRRAERMEREAKERAEVVYRQANGALADATVRVDEAYAQLGDLADRVNEQLSQLQQAVTASRQALSDATVSLYHIAPDLNK